MLGASGERALWVLELALLVAVAGSMVLVHRRRIAAPVAVAFAVLVGVFVATPFGVRAGPISEHEFRAAGGRNADVDATQELSVAGLPLVRMRLYRKTLARSFNGDSGAPSYELRARTWIPPVLAVNASTIAPLCGSSGPCWTPFGRYKDELQLRRGDDGAWRVAIQSDRSSVPGTEPKFWAWRLSYSIVSPWGTLYWLCLIAYFLRRPLTRVRRARSTASRRSASRR